MHFLSLFLNLAKELIRKIKSLKNILDKDTSTDCTVKETRSANTCTPHSAGYLYLLITIYCTNYWNSETSHISILLFSIDFIKKGCNPQNKQYFYSNYSLFLVSRNILSEQALPIFLLSLATGDIAECCWYIFCPVSNLKNPSFLYGNFSRNSINSVKAFWVLKGLSLTLLMYAQWSGMELPSVQ